MNDDRAAALRSWRLWVARLAKPSTITAAVLPVAAGTLLGRWINALVANAVVAQNGHPAGIPDGIIWWRAVLALIVAFGLQVGASFARDYFRAVRESPEADSGSGEPDGTAPSELRLAAIVFTLVGVAAGIALAAAAGWWLLILGAAGLAAGFLYEGGPRPYGEFGLGELAVFVFYGIVATMGATYVQVGRLTLASFVASIPIGFLAVAVLEAKNLRNLAAHKAAGRRTWAVRLGRPRADSLYLGSLMGVALGVGMLAHWRPFALLALLALPLAIAPGRAVLSGAEGRKLLPVEVATQQIQIAAGALLLLGIFL